MVDVADAAGPVDRLHHLLLAASGRVDDQGIDTARELLGSGLPGAAGDFLVGCLLAGHTPVTPKEQQQLRRVLEQVGTRPDPVDRLELVADLPPDEHRFDTAPGISAQVTEALTHVAARLYGVRGLWLAARTTPAGASYGAVPRHVLLTEVGPDGSAAAVAHQLVLALRMANVECSVDVFTTGAQLPEYHRHALAAAEELVPVAAGQHPDSSADAEDIERSPESPAAPDVPVTPEVPVTPDVRHEVSDVGEVPVTELTTAEPEHESILLGAERTDEPLEFEYPPEADPVQHEPAHAASAGGGGQFGADRMPYPESPQAEPIRPETEPAELPDERIGSAVDFPHVPDPERIRAASAQQAAAHESAAHESAAHRPDPRHEPWQHPEPASDPSHQHAPTHQSEPAQQPEPAYEPESPVSQDVELQPSTAQEGGVDADGMRVPAAVDAKLTDRERNLLRKLHEELAQREQTRSGPSEQAVQRPAESWTSTMPGGTGGFPPIGVPANGPAHPNQQRS